MFSKHNQAIETDYLLDITPGLHIDLGLDRGGKVYSENVSPWISPGDSIK